MRHKSWIVGIVGGVLWLTGGASAWAGTRTITVTGTSDDPAASVTVNGTAATVSRGHFSASITLSEGNNTITAMATDPAGNTASASVAVSLDTVPPVIVISSPTNGQVFGAE